MKCIPRKVVRKMQGHLAALKTYMCLLFNVSCMSIYFHTVNLLFRKTFYRSVFPLGDDFCDYIKETTWIEKGDYNKLVSDPTGLRIVSIFTKKKNSKRMSVFDHIKFDPSGLKTYFERLIFFL